MSPLSTTSAAEESAKQSLVPKADGTIIAGAPKRTRALWAGMRPMTRDGHPIVEVTGARNLIVATGHHRKGILLAPLAALQVASIIGRE